MAVKRGGIPSFLLGIALLGSATLLFALCWNFIFFQDTWSFLLDRQGNSLHDFLAPHNEHLVLIPVAINKVAIGLFGMTTAKPEMVVMTATLLVAGALLYIYMHRRIGPWLALMAAVLLLFLGSAWQVLLWPFEIEFSGALMAGIAMLLLLEREDSAGDAWACLLLTISIGFGSLGLSFALAALVDVVQNHRRRGLRRLYVPLVPLALYLVWYAGWGHTAEHHLTLHNILASPAYVLEGFATAVGSLAGLSTTPVDAPGQPEWGRPLLVLLIALVVLWKRRRPGLAPRTWPIAAAALSYWLLAAFNFLPGREASSPRYVYAGVAFVLLLASDLFAGARPSRRDLWIFAALAALAIGPNLSQLKDGANWLKEQTVLTRADTAGLEIARRTVPPSFALTPEIAGTGSLFVISAGPYFEAADSHGSPAYSPAELQSAPAVGRHWADVVLSKALPITSTTTLGRLTRGSNRCVTLSGGAASSLQEVPLEPGVTQVELAPGQTGDLSLRRFAEGEFPVALGSFPGASTTWLQIPRDRSTRTWFLHVEAQQAARVCVGARAPRRFAALRG
jgi:hypothetical protein